MWIVRSILLFTTVALGGELELRGAGSGMRFVDVVTGNECTLLIEGGVLRATCPLEERLS